MLVMSGHLRALFFVGFTEVERPNMAVKGLYLLTSLGHQAVVVFFVLSGWLISASVVRAVANGKWHWRVYLITRLTRLWIVLLPALAVGAFFDLAGMRMFGRDGVYGGVGEYSSIISYEVRDRIILPTLLGNVTFLQAIRVPPFGSNGALWSLAYEFWYYLLFPLIFLLIVSSRKTALYRRIGVFAAILGVLLLVGSSVAGLFMVWLLGTVALLAASSGAAQSPLPRTSAVIGMILIIVSNVLALGLGLVISNGLVSDFLLGLTFAFTLYLVVRIFREELQPTLFHDGARRLASFSFTLYVVHLPLLTFLQAWSRSAGQTRWQPDAAHIGIGMALGVAILIYAYTFSYVTERHTDSLRGKMLSSTMVLKQSTNR